MQHTLEWLLIYATILMHMHLQLRRLDKMLLDEKDIDRLLDAGRDNDPAEIARIRNEAMLCKSSGNPEIDLFLHKTFIYPHLQILTMMNHHSRQVDW